MNPTVFELQNEAAQLIERAEMLRKQAEEAVLAERAEAIETVRTMVAAFCIGPAEAGYKPSDFVARAKKAKTIKPVKVVKYRGPNGETWSGGRGRKPGWVKNIIADGSDIEGCRV